MNPERHESARNGGNRPSFLLPSESKTNRFENTQNEKERGENNGTNTCCCFFSRVSRSGELTDAFAQKAMVQYA